MDLVVRNARVHYGQMSGHEELASMLDFVTGRAARCLGLSDYGLSEGRRADLVVFDAQTSPRHTTVTVSGPETRVSFLKEDLTTP